MKISILNVDIDQITFADALEKITHWAQTKTPHQVVTVNPEFIMRAQSDRSFRQVLNSADLAVPDGAGTLWASRVQKKGKLPERVTGTDLLQALAKRAAEENWRFYLLGGMPGMAKRAADKLQRAVPELKVAGAECGPQIREDGTPLNRDQAALLDAVIGRIRQARPQFLFVGFGAPKQDRFIARYTKELDVPVMMGVGGAFEFIAGQAQRAPKAFRILWLEWLWRLATQPWRIGRIWTAVVRFPLAVFWDQARIDR